MLISKGSHEGEVIMIRWSKPFATLAIGALIFAHAQVRGQPDKPSFAAKDLYTFCDSNHPSCYSYVKGWADGVQAFEWTSGIILNHSLTMDQLTHAFLLYLDKHPAERDIEAGVVMAKAMGEAHFLVYVKPSK
jgi:hypothetical protein